jgi:hypothetical protein
MAAFVGEPDMPYPVGSLLLTNRDRLGYLQFGPGGAHAARHPGCLTSARTQAHTGPHRCHLGPARVSRPYGRHPEARGRLRG